jgi:hypothetical protein
MAKKIKINLSNGQKKFVTRVLSKLGKLFGFSFLTKALVSKCADKKSEVCTTLKSLADSRKIVQKSAFRSAANYFAK